MGCLQIEPEFRCRVERLREEPGCFRGDATLSADKLIDPLNRYAEVRCKRHLGLAERNQEFFAQDLAGMHVGTRLSGCMATLCDSR